MKTTLERWFDAVAVVAVACAALGVLVVVVGDVHGAYDNVDQLQRRVWELERQLAVYTNANGVIVVRDDGECARQWWFAGEQLGCGSAWGRFRVPTTLDTYNPATGQHVPKPGATVVEYGTEPAND